MGTEVGKEPAVSCLPRTLSSEKRCSRQLGPAGADPADGGASSWGWGEGTRDPQAPDLLWSQWGGAEAGQLFTRHSLKEDRCVSIFLSEDGDKASARPAAFLSEGRGGALPVGRRPFYRWGNRGEGTGPRMPSKSAPLMASSATLRLERLLSQRRPEPRTFCLPPVGGGLTAHVADQLQ